MAPKTKINLKDRLEDGELDLSMSDIQEVPVKDIAVLKKATSLDLSNNRITSLPKNFITLSNIIKLDLSKNQLKELPEDFGEMKQLKHLDLYSNQLTHLPLSFCDLKALRWLDLKNNPLVPAVAKVAGQCLDAAQCQQCARNIVTFFSHMKVQIEEEKIRREELRQQQEEAEMNHQKLLQKKKDKKKAAKAKKNKLKAEKKESDDVDIVTSIGCARFDVSKPVPEKKPVHKSKTNSSSCCGLLFKLTFFTLTFAVITLFIFSSSKNENAHGIKHAVLQMWNNVLEATPQPWRPTVTTLGGYVEQVHSLSGIIMDNIMSFIEEARRNEQVDRTLRIMSDGVNIAITESKKIFDTLSDKAILLSNEIKKKIV